MVDRRAFMKSGAMALFAAGLGGVPTFIARAADSKKIVPPYKKNKVLVCIFQRGAMDGELEAYFSIGSSRQPAAGRFHCRPADHRNTASVRT